VALRPLPIEKQDTMPACRKRFTNTTTRQVRLWDRGVVAILDVGFVLDEIIIMTEKMRTEGCDEEKTF
jgi:hypothetical protein